jgi:hypothetical protein
MTQTLSERVHEAKGGCGGRPSWGGHCTGNEPELVAKNGQITKCMLGRAVQTDNEIAE